MSEQNLANITNNITAHAVILLMKVHLKLTTQKFFILLPLDIVVHETINLTIL